MKAEILKIAGVTSEKEFYKKFPTKEAFMKQYGKEFKKAKRGASIQDEAQIKKLEQLLDFGNPPQAEIGAYVGGQKSTIASPVSLQGYYDKFDMSLSGSTNAMRQAAADRKAQAEAMAAKGGGGGGDMMGQLTKMLGGMGGGGGTESAAGDLAGGADIGELASSIARHGKRIPRAQNGIPYYLDPNSANPPAGPYSGYNSSQSWAQSMYDPNAPTPAQANANQAIVPPYSPSYTGPIDPAAANAVVTPQASVAPAIPNMVTTSKKGEGFKNFVKENAGPLTGAILSGIDKLKEEKEQRRAAEQMRDLSALTLRATQSSAMLPPERRRYTTPDQYMMQATQGTGYDVLSAENGMQIGGNLTEIQNMYNPGDLYSDLGFEPLHDSEVVKQYQKGGPIKFNFNNPPANAADSMFVYEQALKDKAWFDRNRNYEKTHQQPAKNFETKGSIHNTLKSVAGEEAEYRKGRLKDVTGRIKNIKRNLSATAESYQSKDQWKKHLNELETLEKEKKSLSLPYRVNIDKNRYKQRELTSSILNPDVPMGTYDLRIEPQRVVTYSNVGVIDKNLNPYLSDVVEFPEYDPLAVLPVGEFKRVYGKNADKMLQKRKKLYGNTGITPEPKKAPSRSTPTPTETVAVEQTAPIQTVQTAPAPSPAVPGGESVFGPGNSLIGFMNKGTFTPYSNSAMKKADRELLQNNEELQKYVGQKFGKDYVKFQRDGGYTPIAQDGNFLSQFAGAGGGDLASSGMNAAYGQNAGGDIGKSIGKETGKVIGNAILPGVGGMVGGMIGGIGGDIAGRLLDKNPQRIKRAQEQYQRNLQAAALTSASQGIHSQYSTYMEDGGLIPYAEDGWMSHDWQPQVIASFGEHRMSDLLRPDPMMDTLRTGGRITQNNMYPEDSYALGGEIKTHWGGHAEPISYNPYLPGTGETVMFKGQSHEESDGKGRTGIGVSYGKANHDDYTQYAEDGAMTAADVEVEANEPGMEMIDPETGEKVFEVLGNLIINQEAANFIGDPKAVGMKYKNYGKKVSEDEAKQEKTITKASDKIDSLEAFTPIDRLKVNSLTATIMGANMRMKDNASKKTNAATYQNGTNEVSSNLGIVADDFAKGKITLDTENETAMAKYGIELAAKGKKKKKKSSSAALPKLKFTVPDRTLETLPELTAEEKRLQEEEDRKALQSMPVYDPLGQAMKEEYMRRDGDDALDARYQNMSKDAQRAYDEDIYNVVTSRKQRKMNPNVARKYDTWFKTKYPGSTPKNPLFDDMVGYANQAIEYLRPTDQEELDPRQLAGEMAALATNQLQPVEGYQMFQPMVQQQGPRVSLQDQLNANQADFNALVRQTGYNPAASSILGAQKYAANQAILGKEAEANMLADYAARDKAYGVFNEAQLRNQATMREQADKRSAARSLTRSEAINALQSISDKELKNKLENRKLGIMENMYKYRFDKRGRAVNMNPFMQFQTPTVDQGDDLLANGSDIPTFEQYQQIVEAANASKNKKKKESRNGSIVKAIKGL